MQPAEKILRPHYLGFMMVKAVTFALLCFLSASEAVLSCAPENLRATVTTSHTITVQWDTLQANCSRGIRIYSVCFADYANTQNCTAISSNVTSASMQSLQPWTHYNVSVIVFTSNEGGSFSSILVKTEEDAPSCSPTGLIATNIQSTYAHFNWSTASAGCQNGVITAYELCYADAAFIGSVTCRNASILDGLKPYHNYSITVRMYTYAGQGPNSEPFHLMTAQAAPSNCPQNVVLSAADAFSIIISWQPIPLYDTNGIVSAYEVAFRTSADQSLQLSGSHNVTATILSWTLSGLQASTEYGLQVRGWTAAGPGAFSLLYKSRTPLDGAAIGVPVGSIIGVVVVIVIVIVLLQRRRTGGSKRGSKSEPVTLTSIAMAKQRSIRLVEFAARMTTMHSDSLFTEEYEDLNELSTNHPTDVSLLSENASKNRFANILPYDHSRVKLLVSAEEKASDYINASYVPGYSSRQEFIATQAPLPQTVNQFWRMVWEQKVSVIVMLAQLIEKNKKACEQYWPDALNEPSTYGNVAVCKIDESTTTNYCVRTLCVSQKDKLRTVTLLSYLSWPDIGWPHCAALLNFVTVFRTYFDANSREPAVVHCTDGSSWTGLFICLDRLVQHIKNSSEVDIFGTVLDMKEFRTRMVQPQDQYVYIYNCIEDMLLRGHAAAGSGMASSAIDNGASSINENTNHNPDAGIV